MTTPSRRPDPNEHRTENTLRLGERELGKLLNLMDAQAGQPSVKREHVRWAFRKTSVGLTLEQPGGSRQTVIVATRNLSKRGMSVLHSAYVYTGTKCEVSFEVAGREAVRIPGTVRRCEHVGGRAHEVGIQFDEEVSMRDLLGLDPMLEAYSLEHVDPQALHGTVLIAAGSELEQKLLLRMLEETNLTLQVGESIEQTLERAKKGADLVLCDAHLMSAESGCELVAELRASGFDAPVVVAGSGSPGERDEVRMAGASGYLSKPFNEQRVRQALAEFLLSDSDGGPIYSSLDAEDPMNELISTFLRELPRLALALETSMRENDAAGALKACRVLSGTGRSLGFGELSDLAIRAESALGGDGGVRAGGADLRALLIACRRVKHRPMAS